MVDLPIEYSQRLPSGKGPAATTNVDLSAPYRAMQQAGGAIAQVASQVREAEESSEFSSLKMQQEMRWNAAYRQMQTEFDETKRNEIYQSAVKDIQGMKSKSGRVNTALTEHLNSKMPQYQDQYFNLDLAQKKVVAEERYNTVGQYQLETGKLEEYYETLDERLAVGNITPVKHEYLKKYAYVDSFLAQARKEVDKDPSFAIALLDSMPTSADKASNEQLDEKDKLITHARSIMNRQADELAQVQDQQLLGLFTKIENGEPISWEEVANTDLPATGELGKTTFWKWYQNQLEEKERTFISQIEQGDPAVNAQVSALVDLRPGDIGASDLYKMIDKGLGTNKVASLVNRLEENKKGDPLLSKYRTELGRLHTAGIFGKISKLSTSNRYLDLSRKLDAFLSTKPTDEQAARFFSSLIQEDVRTIGFLSGNRLPGWDDSPLTVVLKTKEGKENVFQIRMGDIVEFEGKQMQAVGREAGEVQWRTLNPQ